MSPQVIRPERPTKAKVASKPSIEKPIRITIEVTTRTRNSLKSRAAEEGKTIRGYLLEMMAQAGVDVSHEPDMR